MSTKTSKTLRQLMTDHLVKYGSRFIDSQKSEKEIRTLLGKIKGNEAFFRYFLTILDAEDFWVHFSRYNK